MERKFIYPDVQYSASIIKFADTEDAVFQQASGQTSESGEKHIRYFTKLRKLHIDGKWYLQDVLERGIAKSLTDEQRILNQFLLSVHLAMTLGKVDLNCLYLNKQPVFELDEYQQSEEDRLTKITGWPPLPLNSLKKC
jgi:hypothetical protein